MRAKKATEEQHRRPQKESTSPPTPLRDGEGSRKMFGQEATDPVESTVGLAQDQVIGKPENHEPRSSKPSIPAAVAWRPGEVRGTIGFDDEACLLAEEVDDKWSDRMLASEFGAHDLSVPQHLPEKPFCWRTVASQGTRLGGRRSWQPGHECLSENGTGGCFSTRHPAPLSVPERGWG
jgi:hypothetical protein